MSVRFVMIPGQPVGKGRPLIVTTNLSMQDIKSEKNYGRRRLYDRMVEMCRPVVVKGESRRPEIARAKYESTMRILGLEDLA